MKALLSALGAFVLSVVVAVVLAAGCGTNNGNSFGDGGRGDATKDGSGTTDVGGKDGPGLHFFDGGAMDANCVGLCKQQTCATTSISGTVYDPAGLVPLLL